MLQGINQVGQGLWNRLTTDPKNPSRTSLRRLFNTSAGTIVGVFGVGLASTLAAGRISYGLSDGNKAVAATVALSWGIAYMAITRWAVGQAFSQKKCVE